MKLPWEWLIYLGICLTATTAPGQVVDTELDLAMSYDQSNPSSSPSPILAGSLYAELPTDATAVTLVTPTNVFLPLTLQSSGTWSVVAHQGAVNGTYTFLASGGTIGSVSVLVQANKNFPTEDFFTGNTLSNLTTDNVSSPIAVTFLPFVPDSAANYSDISLVIFDPNNTIVSAADLNLSATGFVLPANTLQPGTSYRMQLQVSNFYNFTSIGFPIGGVDYATNTNIEFTTAAVPEPSGLTYLLIGAAALGIRRWRR